MEHTECKATFGDSREDLPDVDTGQEFSIQPGVFIPSDVLQVFNAHFLDYDFARLWILKRLHPAGAFCPRCGVPVPNHKLRRFWSAGRLSCLTCGKFFTALTDTFIAGCQLDFRNLVLLSVLLALGVHDRQTAAIVGMCPDNVRLWRYKFESFRKTSDIKLSL